MLKPCPASRRQRWTPQALFDVLVHIQRWDVYPHTIETNARELPTAHKPAELPYVNGPSEAKRDVKVLIYVIDSSTESFTGKNLKLKDPVAGEYPYAQDARFS